MLPFGIKEWQHKHIVKQCDVGVEIVDEIEFSAGNILLDCFWYVGFLPQFLLRKPQYKKFISTYE